MASERDNLLAANLSTRAKAAGFGGGNSGARCVSCDWYERLMNARSLRLRGAQQPNGKKTATARTGGLPESQGPAWGGGRLA